MESRGECGACCICGGLAPGDDTQLEGESGGLRECSISHLGSVRGDSRVRLASGPSLCLAAPGEFRVSNQHPESGGARVFSACH